MEFLRCWLPRRGRPLLWLIATLSAASLSCISLEVAIRVQHKQGEQGELHGQIGMHLTDVYLNAARTANQERAADYQAVGLDVPEPLFPVTWAEFDEAGFGSGDLTEGDGEIVEQSEKGYTIAGSRAYTESQGVGVEDNSLALQVDRSDPQMIRYLLEIEILDMSEDLDPTDLDQLRADGLGPKPVIEKVKGEVEIETGDEDLGTEIVTGILEELFGAMPELAGLELDSWYAKRVLLAAGMPSMSYSVEMPGRITSHTLAGETSGTVDLPGNRVELIVDENFMRSSGPTSGIWRITSELHKCDELCTKTEHMVWDGTSPPDNCQCDCEEGWDLAADGKSCVPSSGARPSKPQYPARNIENTDQFVKLLLSRGYSETHCIAGAHPPGSVYVWNLGSRIAHSSVMTADERQIEMGDKPGGKRYISELLKTKTNPTTSKGKSYSLNMVLCPPPGTVFDAAGAQTMGGIDRNYGEPDKWNCHGFSANVIARYATTGIRIEPGSKYRWDGNTLMLEKGRVYVKDNHTVRIQLKGGTLHPQSSYMVEVDTSGAAQLYVLDGSVSYQGQAGSISVPAGQVASIDGAGAPGQMSCFDAGALSTWWEHMDADLFQESRVGILQGPWSKWLLIGGGVVCGGGLLAVLGGGLILRRRRRSVKPAPSPLPASPYPPPRSAPVDPFTVAEQQFAALRSAYRAGKIDRAGMQKAISQLIVKDVLGNYWAIAGSGGRWHYFDGTAWVPRDRPR